MVKPRVFEFPYAKTVAELKKKSSFKLESMVTIWRFYKTDPYEFSVSFHTNIIDLEVLGHIYGSEVFLGFLNKFGRGIRERLNKFLHLTYTARWEIRYGYLLTAYRFFKKNPEKFGEALDKTKRLKDFIAIAGVYDNE